jgi:hypothetical protein
MKVLLVGLLSVASVIGQGASEFKKATIEDFAFMKGCWAIERPERKLRIEEQWMAPAGGTMIGMSRTVRDGKTTGWEFMRVEVGDAGASFVSKPRENKEETVFKFASAPSESGSSNGSRYAAFENPQHDFPQRVIYRSDKPDTLSARIEGTQNGKSSGIDFPYKRVKCE